MILLPPYSPPGILPPAVSCGPAKTSVRRTQAQRLDLYLNYYMLRQLIDHNLLILQSQSSL
jgi:hypothetical protein